MHKPLVVVFTLAATLVVCLPVQAGDTDAAVEKQFTGTYKLTVSQKKARKKILRQINGVVDDMLFIKRPFARDALEEKTEPCAKLAFAFPGARVSVTCDSKPPTVVPDNDKLTKYKAHDGNVYRVRMKRRGRVLRQIFVGENGRRINTMTLSKDGKTVTMKTRMESSKLPRPLEYELTFRR